MCNAGEAEVADHRVPAGGAEKSDVVGIRPADEQVGNRMPVAVKSSVETVLGFRFPDGQPPLASFL